MSDFTLRLIIFTVVLTTMAILEARFPRRQRTQTRQQRWTTNFTVLIFEIIALRLLGPVSAVVAANYAMDNGWGLLSRLGMPFYLDVIVSFLLLDFAIYLQHIASHKWAWFWRLHKVHHADRDIDVTTGFRFHPLEAALSMLYKCAIILLFGPIITAVILFEIILNASAMFNHANLKLPPWLDRTLRTIIVTQDMHRVHHSSIQKETDSNYGFFLSIWDRLCGTYTAQPSKGHNDMTIGLAEYQSDAPATIKWSLTIPFISNRDKTDD